MSNSNNSFLNMVKKDNNNSSIPKQEDFLNIFEFNNLETNEKEGLQFGNGEVVPLDHPTSSSSNLQTQAAANRTVKSTSSSGDDLNDLNKLLSNSVGNSEYIDMPLPMIFANGGNNLTMGPLDTNGDNFDADSLLSYTTNNSYMTNNTVTKIGRHNRLGSVKSFRSTTADSLDDQVVKERKKKIHNNVEKKRRELIKHKIQELNELLPLSVIKIVNAKDINDGLILNGRPKSELVDPFTISNKEVKVRKRDILCGSLIYMKFLSQIIHKVNKKTSQYDKLYSKLAQRMNQGQKKDTENRSIDISEKTRSKDIKAQETNYNQNDFPQISSKERNQENSNFSENIHDMDEFASFLKSMNDNEPQQNELLPSQSNININAGFNNFDQFDNLLNMSNINDDTFKNLLLHPGHTTNNKSVDNQENYNIRQNESPNNADDPFSSWLNI
ncbi:hypothetical protein QEN19_003292 [Hanseniaspora menglaensis]